jgi:hypothetical protein
MPKICGFDGEKELFSTMGIYVVEFSPVCNSTWLGLGRSDELALAILYPFVAFPINRTPNKAIMIILPALLINKFDLL